MIDSLHSFVVAMATFGTVALIVILSALVLLLIISIYNRQIFDTPTPQPAPDCINDEPIPTVVTPPATVVGTTVSHSIPTPPVHDITLKDAYAFAVRQGHIQSNTEERP